MRPIKTGDLTFACRSLLRGGLTSVVAIVSLAVGIGANTTVFSLVQAVEFPALIYPDSSRLVFVESRNDARGLSGLPVSLPDARDLMASVGAFENATVTAEQTSVVRVGDQSYRVSGRRVSPPFFTVMAVRPALGRVLGAADREGVIVLSDTLWRSQFGADASLVGRSIRLDGGTVTVVGVMPPRFDVDADFWTPLSVDAAAFTRDDRQFEVFARLRRGLSLPTARAEVEAVSHRLAADHAATNRAWVMSPTPIAHLHGRDSRATFLLLQAAVGFVLLIGCANIANLLLARGTRRRLEMAIRVSLGATRTRLLRALLVESLVLSMTGGAFGVLLSLWGIHLARALGGFPEVIDPHLNPLVLAFTLALSMLTGIVCGVFPAIRASSISPEPVLRDGGRGSQGALGGRLRALLVGGEIAAALVLAIAAALMVRTLVNREQVDLGFDVRHAMRGDVGLPADRYPRQIAASNTVDSILARVAGSPDVAAAGVSTFALPTPAGGFRQLTLPGDRDVALSPSARRGFEAVTPGYFDAYGIPVKHGRVFNAGDRAGTTPVAVVNDELVRRLWPGRNPIGERLRLGTAAEHAPIVTIVGVVGTVRRSPMHDVPVSRVYVAFAQYPQTVFTVFVRTRGDLAAGARALASAVSRTDPDLLVENARTLEEDAAHFVAPVRLLTVLLSGFAVTGVLLAALGVFGAMSYVVTQRQPEMALRSALGASYHDILRMVFGDALRMAAAGIMAGAIVCVWATRALAGYLFGVRLLDPVTYVTVALTLAGVALAACYRPARVAATVDPMTLLR